MNAVALKVAEQPEPAVVLSGDQIEGTFWPWLMSGKWVRATFKDTCEPDDITRLVDMRDRRFIKFAPQSEGNVTAVYISQDGWGNLSRSFSFQILDNTSASAREKFSGIARRLHKLEIFD